MALGCLCAAASSAFAQGTAFTYQGQLTDGGRPANGSYNLTFTLFDTNLTGSPIAGPLTNSAVGITSGWFTVSLDFGSNFPGANRWLELGVQTNGGGAVGFATLRPRQYLTPTPYAITAANLVGSLSASQLTGLLTTNQAGSITNHSDVNANNLAPGQALIFGGALWTNSSLPVIGPIPSNNIPVLLAFSGTNVLVNAALGTHFRLTATNNFLLQNPAGATDAQRIVFEIIQDSAGGRTMTFGSAFKFGADIPVINLTTNAGQRDFISCVCSGTNFYVVGFVKGF